MRTVVAAALAVALAIPAARTPAALEKAGGPAPATLRVAFKLDPRLAGPTYGGERWVSPPTYQGARGQDAVEAQASAVDARRIPVKTAIDWAPSDPEMVTVTPARGAHVRIAVRRPGRSTVTLKAGEASRKLTIEAARTDGVWHLTISQ